MKLESIRLRNFRSFKDAEMRSIPNLCVLVGANGVGNRSHNFNVLLEGIRWLLSEGEGN